MRKVMPILVVMLLVGCSQANIPTSPPAKGDTSPTTQSKSDGWVMVRMVSEIQGWGIKDGGVFTTKDGGRTWTLVTPPGVLLAGQSDPAYFLDADRAWVAESRDRKLTICMTVDGGQTWDQVALDTEGGAQFHFVDEQNGWVLLHQGVAMGSEQVAIYRTADGGKTWSKVAGADPTTASQPDQGLPFGGIKKGISFRDALVGWVTAEDRGPGGGRFYRTSDGGATWGSEQLPIPEAYASHSLTIYPPKFFSATAAVLPVTFVPGYETIFYASGDGGLTWTPTSPVPATTTATAVHYDFVDARHGWTTDGRQVYATQNGGQTWSEYPAPSGFGTVRHLHFRSVQVGWAVTDEGLMSTDDGGRSWR